MTLATWITFFLACWAISLSPGPGAIAAMTAGLNQGFKRGYFTVLGLVLGIWTQMIIVVIGLGAIIKASETAFTAMKFLGAAYLIHAGLNILRRGPNWEGFLRLVDATDRQRGFGDYAGYGLVADGRSEIYAEAGLKPWDLAPCKIVVEEAGGRFTDFDGRPTIYTGTALATNGRLHDAVLSLLRA